MKVTIISLSGSAVQEQELALLSWCWSVLGVQLGVQPSWQRFGTMAPGARALLTLPALSWPRLNTNKERKSKESAHRE